MTIPFSTSPRRSVTAEERTYFAEHGVVHLPGIYPADWVEHLEVLLADVFDGPPGARQDSDSSGDGGETGSEVRTSVDMVSLTERVRQARPGVALAIEGLDREQHPGGELTAVQPVLAGRSIVETDASGWHAGMRDHNIGGPLPQIVAELTESAAVNFYSDQLFLKEPGSRVQTPFHQDKPYFLIDGGVVAVCWVPVDSVTSENGAMRYVRGSHRWDVTFKPSDFVTASGTFPEVDGIDLSGLETLPPINDEHDVVSFDAEPGDVIVHHWATIHGSRGNVSTVAKRRAASIRYALDGCRYYQRPSSPEPFRFTTGLQSGERLDMSPRFPVVWPRLT